MNGQTKQEVKQILIDKCSLPLELFGAYRRPTDYPEATKHLGDVRSIRGHHHQIVQKINAFYRSVFSWIKANPSEEGLADAIKSVFCWCDDKTVLHKRAVNTLSGHKAFLDELMDKSTNTMILLGKRGSGKTFYLNYLLNTTTKRMYDDSRLVWYRVDATKVFTYNISAASPGERLSLRDYLNLQIPYVTLKYREQMSIWQEIFQYQNEDVLSIIRDLCKDRECLSKGFPSQDYTKLLNDYQDLIERLKTRDPSEVTKELIREFLMEPNRLITCELVSITILRYIVKHGFRPVIIIDGIDNIDFYKHRDIYEAFVKQLFEFCHRDDKQYHDLNALHIVVMRYDTYCNLQDLQQRFWTEVLVPYSIARLSIPGIVNKKRSVAADPPVKYFRKMKESLRVSKQLEELRVNRDPNFPFEKESDFDEQLSRFADEFLTDIVRTVNRATEGSSIVIRNLYDLLTYIYNDNFRSFIDNFLNVYRYYLLFVLKRHAERGDIKPYLLTEGMILNGNLWLDSPGQCIEPLSDCIPNIFWFDPHKANGHWHGLCLFRLLQFLKFSANTRLEVVEFLQNKLSYSKSIIDERFETAIAFGLIESKFNKDEKKQIFNLTLKGRFFLEYPFLDINQFYYMALDTPLSGHIEGRSLFIQFHVNKDKYWENFTEAAIPTSITLIRHIKTQVAKEKNLIPDPWSKHMNLPHLFPERLINGMMAHFSRLKRISRERYNELMKNIMGVTS